MFQKKHKYAIDTKRGKSKKSELTFDEFKKKIDNLDMDITSFSEYSGIARSTIYGWERKYEIPLYVEKMLELMKINSMVAGAYKMYENNTDGFIKSKRIQDKKSS